MAGPNTTVQLCKIPGCANSRHRAKDVCNAHYLRMYRHGTYDLTFRSILDEPLTQERLKRCLSYAPETGVFRWLVAPRIGHVIGSKPRNGANSHRLSIRLDGKSYYAHRLAWLYVYGKWPIGMIDHIDGNANNNRIANLREATRSQNNQNQRRASVRSRTGMLGVVPVPSTGKFSAQIVFDGRSIHLGTFETPDEAHAAYVDAKRKYHPFNTL
jgi:hypothetical protein